MKGGQTKRDEALGKDAAGLTSEQKSQRFTALLKAESDEELKLLQEWAQKRRSGDADEAAAYKKLQQQRKKMADLGMANEAAATPWTMQGQYEADFSYTKPQEKTNDKGETKRVGNQDPYPEVAFYVPYAGVTKSRSGAYMPAYRDYSGSGTVSDGQRDIGGAAIGTGVLIHKGVGYADSQGCNVGGMEGLLHRLNTDMSQDQSDDKASETSMSDKGKHIGYLVIEAKNLPPFE